MIAFLAVVVGASIAIVALSALVSLGTRRVWGGTMYRVATIAIAYVLAVVLAALGNADGGPIEWGVGIVPYGIGALIVGGLWQFGAVRRTGADDR